jgi:golgi phosphoprotein 3
MFTLYEEILLLSIHEEKGTIIGSSVDQLKPGLAGALLAELTLMGKIQTSNNHRLQLIDNSPMNIDVLDETLKALKESEKERKFGYWISTLNPNKDKFRKQIIGSLDQKGIFTQEADHIQWVVASPIHPETKASTKYWVTKRLRGIVLGSEEIQPRDTILLSLVSACGLLDLVFLRDERKLASRMINQLFYSQAINDPVFQTVQEIDTALADLVEED